MASYILVTLLGMLACFSTLSLANPILGCPVAALGVPMSDSDFDNNATLSNDFFLQWNVNSTHIIFKAQVHTTGYVGLGISEAPAMYPSDLVVGWVDFDGIGHMKDRHANYYGIPPVDDHQDWTLINAFEMSGVTTLTVVRALNTCDDQDIVITAGPQNVIWSFNNIDPVSHQAMNYHGPNRGVAILNLI